MLTDNLKLDPVTLGFLNIIYNLGTNITNTILFKIFFKKLMFFNHMRNFVQLHFKFPAV